MAFFNAGNFDRMIFEYLSQVSSLKPKEFENLNYFDDVDSKFGLYDYSLLINIKSWNNIFYTVNVNTVDFKLDKDEDEEFLYYEYTGQSKHKNKIIYLIFIFIY